MKMRFKSPALFFLALYIISIFYLGYLFLSLLSPDSDYLFNNYQLSFLLFSILILIGFFLFKKEYLFRNQAIMVAYLLLSLFTFFSLNSLITGIPVLIGSLIVLGLFHKNTGFIQKNERVLIFLIFVILIIFVCFEIFSRIYLTNSLALLPSYGLSMREFSKAGLIEKVDSANLSYQLKPNISTRFLTVNFTTNSQGLRDKEYSFDKPANTFRVAVIGDSATVPFGVNIEDAYHSLLENYYNMNNASLNYEFINFGVGGYDIDDYVYVVQNKALDYNPDAIIISFLIVNDFVIQDYDNFEVKKLRVNSYYRIWSFKFFNYAIKSIIANFEGRSDPNYQLQRIDYLFSELNKTSKDSQIPVIVVSLNRVEERQAYNYEYLLLANLTDKYRMQLIDTSYKFEGIPFSKTKIMRDDNHGNELANRLYAEAIEENLNI